jgi:hypothetical protein
MTTTKDVANKLTAAAEKLTGNQLTSEDANTLISFFNQGSGASYDRALHALSRFTKLNQNEIMNKTAESEEIDEVLMDLQFTVENWRPGS